MMEIIRRKCFKDRGWEEKIKDGFLVKYDGTEMVTKLYKSRVVFFLMKFYPLIGSSIQDLFRPLTFPTKLFEQIVQQTFVKEKNQQSFAFSKLKISKPKEKT